MLRSPVLKRAVAAPAALARVSVAPLNDVSLLSKGSSISRALPARVSAAGVSSLTSTVSPLPRSLASAAVAASSSLSARRSKSAHMSSMLSMPPMNLASASALSAAVDATVASSTKSAGLHLTGSLAAKSAALAALSSSPLPVVAARASSSLASTHADMACASSASTSEGAHSGGASSDSGSDGRSSNSNGKRRLSPADLLTGVKAALIGAAGYGLLTQDGGMFTDPAELVGGSVCFSFFGLRLVNVRGSYYLAYGQSAIRVGPEHVITAINAAVFLMWRVPALQTFMEKHFMTSYAAVMSGRWHTLLTAAFSHHSFFHILFNSMALLSIAPLVSRHWDFGKFCGIWTGSAIFSSLAQVFGGAAIATAMLRTGHAANVPQMMAPMLGASGAVGTLISYVCLTYPKTRFTVMFAIDTSAASLLPCLAAFDIGGLIGTAMGFFTSPFGHLAHLGGYAFGLGVYKWDQRNRPRRW